MKAELKKTSKPALDELQRLLTPSPDQLVGLGGESLAKLQRTAKAFARFRDQALDAALSTQPSDSVSSLNQAEQKIARDHSGLDRDGIRVLEKNREIAKDHNVPAEEAAGIEECNLWRLYVGLNGLGMAIVLTREPPYAQSALRAMAWCAAAQLPVMVVPLFDRDLTGVAKRARAHRSRPIDDAADDRSPDRPHPER